MTGANVHLFSHLELWLVVVKWLNLLLALLFVIMGSLHHRKEHKKLVNLENVRQYNNPLPELRWWILLNMLSQTIACVESAVFIFIPSIDCRYDPKVPNS